VQDGCSHRCAYCIVPCVRGQEKSRPAAEISAEVNQRLGEGYREVVLTGTEIGAYQWQGVSFRGLVSRLLTETKITRIRLSSLQPQELTPDLVALWQDPRLCRHFHISLQSGCEGVLRRMRRDYTPREYGGVVSMIRSRMPEAAITTDIIAGFPGETEAEFAESYDFCAALNFARLHVFTYSPRPGTTAAGMPDQINGQIKKERSQKLLALSKESLRRFTSGFTGKSVMVLWEQLERDGLWSGLTDNYLRVYLKSDEDLTNTLTEVRLESSYRDGLRGVQPCPFSFYRRG
jgi:threonylcarbamoyladenosine tRNA methylthiotransferase MtaB